jgi:hypothetical protein
MMRWTTFDLSDDLPPLDCSVCDETIALDDDPNLDTAYCLSANEHTSNEEIEAFDKAFDCDSLADLLVCWNCFLLYGGDERGDPTDWLEKYLQVNGESISRQEALKRVDDMSDGCQ